MIDTPDSNVLSSVETHKVFLALSKEAAMAAGETIPFRVLNDTFFTAAHGLALTIQRKDPYTGGHTRRVMGYSYAIGKAMSLSEKELKNLLLAAMLHDLGKVEVSDSILLKSERLNADEREEMHMHTKYGAELLLSQNKHMSGVIPGILSHHERFDGKGYPDRLKGDAIPIIARIIAVADTFDAMMSERPYRKAMTLNEALEELRKNSGKQLDAGVVDVFIGFWGERDSILGSPVL